MPEQVSKLKAFGKHLHKYRRDYLTGTGTAAAVSAAASARKRNEIISPDAKLEKAAKEVLEGGLADDIPDKCFDKKKVKKGMKVEREHTKNKAAQKEIAQDHLEEDPDYYEKLEKMEKKGFVLGFEKVSKKKSSKSKDKYDDKSPIEEEIYKQNLHYEHRGE